MLSTKGGRCTLFASISDKTVKKRILRIIYEIQPDHFLLQSSAEFQAKQIAKRTPPVTLLETQQPLGPRYNEPGLQKTQPKTKVQNSTKAQPSKTANQSNILSSFARTFFGNVFGYSKSGYQKIPGESPDQELQHYKSH